MTRIAVLAVGTLLAAATQAAPPQYTIELARIGGIESSVTSGEAAEIVTYDERTRLVFMMNTSSPTVDVIDLSNPDAPSRIAVLDVSDVGPGVNSIDAHDGLVAVAVDAPMSTDPGHVVLFDAESLQRVGPAVGIVVGALPDMLTFSANGRFLVVANEGEPNTDYTIDPEGSVSIIDLRNGVSAPIVRTAGFRRFNGLEDQLRARGIRIFGRFQGSPDQRSSAAQDFEPEYIALSETRPLKAYVSLQENNALAVIDVHTARVESIRPLGYKNHKRKGSGLDASDSEQDPATDPSAYIKIARWPVFGMYQPDGIATFEAGGEEYVITANEGDAREYDALAEEARIEDLVLDSTAFPNAAELQGETQIGRLNVTSELGDIDGDGDYDRLYSFGARSVSIRKPDGTLVWDSGELLERVTAAVLPDQFNVNNDELGPDNRSDNKGPEPEGVAVGRVGTGLYAFVGLERIGGVVVLDITNPQQPRFVQYVNSRDFSADVAGDSGPEGIEFVPAGRSPNGKPLLLVGNEVSRTLAVFSVTRRKR